MQKEKQSRNIPAGYGYGLGLVFGVATMIAFSVAMGATYFGITIGLSFSLSIGIAFECAFAGESKLPVFQKVMLSLSAILLVFSVISLLLWDEMYLF